MLDLTGTTVRDGVYRIDAALAPVLNETEEVYPGGDAPFPRENHPVMPGSEPVDCIAYPVSPQHIVGRPIVADGDWMTRRSS